jgi:hypothetical protein
MLATQWMWQLKLGGTPMVDDPMIDETELALQWPEGRILRPIPLWLPM